MCTLVIRLISSTKRGNNTGNELFQRVKRAVDADPKLTLWGADTTLRNKALVRP